MSGSGLQSSGHICDTFSHTIMHMLHFLCGVSTLVPPVLPNWSLQSGVCSFSWWGHSIECFNPRKGHLICSLLHHLLPPPQLCDETFCQKSKSIWWFCFLHAKQKKIATETPSWISLKTENHDDQLCVAEQQCCLVISALPNDVIQFVCKLQTTLKIATSMTHSTHHWTLSFPCASKISFMVLAKENVVCLAFSHVNTRWPHCPSMDPSHWPAALAGATGVPVDSEDWSLDGRQTVEQTLLHLSATPSWCQSQVSLALSSVSPAQDCAWLSSLSSVLAGWCWNWHASWCTVLEATSMDGHVAITLVNSVGVWPTARALVFQFLSVCGQTRGASQNHSKQSCLIKKCEEIAGIACGVMTSWSTPMEKESGHIWTCGGLCMRL